MLKSYRFFILLIIAFLIVGGIGGGVLGGVAGYELATSRAVQVQSAVAGQLISAPIVSRNPAVGSSSPNQDTTVVDTVKLAEPAVVTIINTTQTRTQRNGVVPAIAEGSGVIIDQQGHIV